MSIDMHSRLAILCLWISCALGGGLHAAEKPGFLAAFDAEVDAIQLEFENQAEPGCFWSPYRVRDELLADLESQGFKVSDSSIYVLSILAWGAETDDYHCAVVLEAELRKHGVTAEVAEGQTVSTDIVIWDASEMMTGPKIHMDDRIRGVTQGYMADMAKAITRARQ